MLHFSYFCLVYGMYLTQPSIEEPPLCTVLMMTGAAFRTCTARIYGKCLSAKSKSVKIALDCWA